MEQQNTSNRVQPYITMKWHHFLIYFYLWVAAAYNAIQGITTLTGQHYVGGADLLYAYYANLKLVDILFGCLMLVCAVLCLVTRFKLAAMERWGAKLVVWMPLAEMVLSWLHVLAVSTVTDVSIGDYAEPITIIISAVCTITLVVCNKVYYTKRDFMFTE